MYLYEKSNYYLNYFLFTIQSFVMLSDNYASEYYTLTVFVPSALRTNNYIPMLHSK